MYDWKKITDNQYCDGEVLRGDNFSVFYSPVPTYDGEITEYATILLDQREKKARAYVLNGDHRASFRRESQKGFHNAYAWYEELRPEYRAKKLLDVVEGEEPTVGQWECNIEGYNLGF